MQTSTYERILYLFHTINTPVMPKLTKKGCHQRRMDALSMDLTGVNLAINELKGIS